MTLRALVTLTLLVSGIAPGRAQPPPAPVSADVQARLSRLLPAPALPDGAEQPPAFYDAATLFQYMDGAADAFQGYDVQALLHLDTSVRAVDLTIDIFDMGTLENAFGMYAAERSPAYDFVTVGAEGYRNEGILNFFQDRYYVKLAAFGEGADAVLGDVAAAISERIGASKHLPALLSRLPPIARKPRTEHYVRKDPLGLPFLGPAYQAVYGFGMGDSTLVVSIGSDASEAASRLKLLQDHFSRTGQWSQAPELGAGAIRASNKYEGSLLAATSGAYLVILLDPSNSPGTFFTEALARLR